MSIGDVSMNSDHLLRDIDSQLVFMVLQKTDIEYYFTIVALLLSILPLVFGLLSARQEWLYGMVSRLGLITILLLENGAAARLHGWAPRRERILFLEATSNVDTAGDNLCRSLQGQLETTASSAPLT